MNEALQNKGFWSITKWEFQMDVLLMHSKISNGRFVKAL